MKFRIRFHPSDCLYFHGKYHKIMEQTEDGVVLGNKDQPGNVETFTYSEILTLLRSQGTRLLRNFFSQENATARLRNGDVYMSTLPVENQRQATFKMMCCNEFLNAYGNNEVKKTEASIRKFLPTLTERVRDLSIKTQRLGKSNRAGKEATIYDTPSPRTLLAWLRLYEQSGRSALSLLRKTRSDATFAKKYESDVVKLLNACIWDFMSEQSKPRKAIARLTRDRFKEENERRVSQKLPELHIPSIREIERRIARFRKFFVKAARDGAAIAKKDMAIFEGGLTVTHPMQFVQIDEWQIDVFSMFDESGLLDGLDPDQRARFAVGRRWLYLAIDVATRCIVGFRLSATQSSEDAVQTLSLISEDKTPLARAAGCESDWPFYGGVGTLSTDQGPAFVALDFTCAVTDLLYTHVGAVAGVPKLRGHIERVFGTFASQLMPELTGRTFSNPIQKGDYPGEDLAALTDEELSRIFTLFIVDIYHNTPHSGLQGRTPANAWKRISKQQGVTAPPDATTKCAVFGIPVERKVGRHGVLAFGIHYSCPELQESYLEGQSKPIKVRVNPNDLTYVSVYIGNTWSSAKAIQDSVHGLSLETWLSITRELRLKFKREAEITEDIVRRARKKIGAINEEAIRLRRLQPLRVTSEYLHKVERDLFQGLKIRPDRFDPPVDQAPKGLGLLGDKITPQKPQERNGPQNGPAKPQKPWGFHDE